MKLYKKNNGSLPIDEIDKKLKEIKETKEELSAKIIKSTDVYQDFEIPKTLYKYYCQSVHSTLNDLSKEYLTNDKYINYGPNHSEIPDIVSLSINLILNAMENIDNLFELKIDEKIKSFYEELNLIAINQGNL